MRRGARLVSHNHERMIDMQHFGLTLELKDDPDVDEA